MNNQMTSLEAMTLIKDSVVSARDGTAKISADVLAALGLHTMEQVADARMNEVIYQLTIASTMLERLIEAMRAKLEEHEGEVVDADTTK